MKITQSVINDFKHTEHTSGTKIALENVIWKVASSLMKDIGAKRVSTSYFSQKRGTTTRQYLQSSVS